MLAHECEITAPENYLNPNLFSTVFDRPDRAKDQYAKGLELGKEWPRISIGVNGTWSGCRFGAAVDSYEKIGYHANTRELLQGFLDSGTQIFVYRWENRRVKCYQIQ
jgi:hypothetical protein